MTTRRKRSPKRTTPGSTRASRAAAEAAVRWSRILSAQARIASGYYELEEVRESVVDALMEEMDRR